MPPDVDRIGIVGVGVQATWQAVFACAIRPVRTIYFYSRSDEGAKRFSAAVSRHVPGVSLIPCRDVEDLLAQSPVVIAATTANAPVLPARQELLENRHFVGVGSFKPAMQELPAIVYQLAREVVVDSDAAKAEGR